MRAAMLSALVSLALGLCLAPRAPCEEAPAEDEFAGLPHEERKAGADAQKAEEALKKARAQVKLVTYAGGHGWQGNLWQRMKGGLTFLEEQRPGSARAR